MKHSRKDIAVLVRRSTVLTFLKAFFSTRKTFRPRYCATKESLLKLVHQTPPAAVISEDPLLQAVADRITKIPVVAMISGNAKAGIESALNSGVKCYLYRPHLQRDLEHKLETVIAERELISRMESDLRELMEVADLTRLITSTLDPKEVLYRVVRKIADIMPVTRCSIIRVDWLRKSAFVIASFEDPQISGLRLSLSKYPEILEALTSKKPVVINDVESDPLMRRVKKLILPLGIRSILVVPVLFRDRVIGTLFIRTSLAQRSFSESEMRLLNTIAESSAIALYNAFLFEQVEDEKARLEKLAITDYLTGIYNVRYFFHRIIEEFSRAQRYSQPISCLMADLDHFKRINDVHGHKTGDRVLKEFALFLKRHSRRSDVLARYGGEEFIILLPQTTVEGAIAEAERLRQGIRQHVFKSLRGRDSLTVSIGVAAGPHPRITSHDELISAADNALFAAKNGGRDRVALFEE